MHRVLQIEMIIINIYSYKMKSYSLQLANFMLLHSISSKAISLTVSPTGVVCLSSEGHPVPNVCFTQQPQDPERIILAYLPGLLVGCATNH